MKDFLGNELKVGDAVVWLTHSRTSSHFESGRVVGFTPKKVYVSSDPKYSATLRTSDKVVKYEFN